MTVTASNKHTAHAYKTQNLTLWSFLTTKTWTNALNEYMYANLAQQ